MDANKPSKDVVNHGTAPDHFEHIFLVTGPAGCGKTTVAQHLAEQISAPYIEGDDVSNECRTPNTANHVFSSIHQRTRKRWEQAFH